MDKNREYIRELPDSSDTVVVFIHGILGTPHHFKELVALVPNNYAIYNILLKGHGGKVEDFAKASMQQWKKQVCELFERLSKQYEKIYIVAHSMGTLFAIEQAIIHPNVKGLFLLNVPLRPYLHPRLIIPMLTVAFGLNGRDNSYVEGIRGAYSIAPEKNIMKYIFWIPNYIALFCEIAKVRRIMKDLQKPVTALMSYRDELVLRSSYSELNLPNLKRGWLKKSGHFFYEKEDADKIQNCFKKWLELNEKK